MEAGTIASWNVKEGDSFGAGDVIAEIETDKATMGFEAQDPGVVAKILVQAGQEIKVGTPVVIIVDDTDDEAALVAAFAEYTAAESAPAPSPTPAPAPALAPPAPAAAAAPVPVVPAAAAPPAPLVGEDSAGRVFASPLARAMARDSSLDVRAIPPTGPRGRVTAADVARYTQPALAEAATAAAPAAVGTAAAAAPVLAPSQGDGFMDFPVSEASREIAARMTKAKQQVPHYYLTVDIEMDQLLKTRALLNSALADDAQLTVNDLLVKGAALAMKAVPDVNASWMETAVRVFSRCDINVVLGSGDGLVAPVVVDAGSKGVKAISDEIRAAAAGVEAGTLPTEAYAVGTFTVMNLGMYGVKSAAPIVTMPQAAVLGLGAITERVVPAEDAEADEIYRLAQVLTATCSFDHRVVDGAVGAQWLAAFKKLAENPMTMLL